MHFEQGPAGSQDGSLRRVPAARRQHRVDEDAVYKYPVPDWTVVAGYAGGLAALVRSLAFELSGNEIRVNGVSPGPTKTALFAGAPAGLEDKLAGTVLTGRVAQPEDVAITYLSLLKNPNINAEVVHDDGGSYAPKQPKSG